MITARPLSPVEFHRFRSGEAPDLPPATVGSKASLLLEACRLGLRVPPGIVLPVEVARAFFASGERLPSELLARLRDELVWLEGATGLRLADPERPLLVAVRSGAPRSMPGMLDSILNVGLTDALADAWAEREPGLVLDCQARLLRQVGEIVERAAVDPDTGRTAFADEAERVRRHGSGTVSEEDLRALVGSYRKLLEGATWPVEPLEQIETAVESVLRSWNNARAKAYRRQHQIDAALGTAVIIQAMVYGNRDDRSGSGVAFTRDPNSGAHRLFGEYLLGAQGQDVVSGSRDPSPLNQSSSSSGRTLEGTLPEAYSQLVAMRDRLEMHFRDLIEFEFTIESGQVWLLQAKTAQRSPASAFRLAVDMVDEDLVDRDAALLRVGTAEVESLLEPRIAPHSEAEVVAHGLPASPGAASGAVVFTVKDALRLGSQQPVILVRNETSAEDVPGMKAAAGVLTARGGMTCHAAVVARGLGRPCVVGCSALRIDPARGFMLVKDHRIETGQSITIEGATGDVLLGEKQTVLPAVNEAYDRLMGWADERRTLQVRVNADDAKDAALARRLGAEGIGLCRTEAMFRSPDKRLSLQSVLLADTDVGRRAAVRRIEPVQQADLLELFEAMPGLPVVIRLLDPDPSLWRPHSDEEFERVAETLGRPTSVIRAKVAALADDNPELGLRGSRLGVTHPELYEMQTRAVLTAAIEAHRRGVQVRPEIMLPLVSGARELSFLRRTLDKVAEHVFDAGERIDFRIGTMIEVPRAALRARALAESADFFSFGTNDLTQLVFGMARGDGQGLVAQYVDRGLLPADPFTVLDEDGVGGLIDVAVREGRARRPDLMLGLTGRHAGDPRSIRLAQRLGLDYVSCAVAEVPRVRLAAAQAAIQEGR